MAQLDYQPAVCAAKFSVPFALVLPGGKCKGEQGERKGRKRGCLENRLESLQVELGVKAGDEVERKALGKKQGYLNGISRSPAQYITFLHLHRKPAEKSVMDTSISGKTVYQIMYSL